MTRFLRFRRPYWVGSRGSQCTSGPRDVVWKHTVALSGSCIHSLSPAPPHGTVPRDASPQSEVSKNMLEILTALRATHGKLNIEGLSLSFWKEDRSFSCCLPPPKVTKIRVPMFLSAKATSGSSRKRSYDLCSACGPHHTIVPERRKTKGKRNRRMCRIGPGITYTGICSMLIIENMTTPKLYFTMENKYFFSQRQLFISHTLYQLPVTSACDISFLRNTQFLGTNAISCW